MEHETQQAIGCVNSKVEISAGSQLEESVLSGKKPCSRNDTRGTDRTTDRIRKQNERRVPIKAKHFS